MRWHEMCCFTMNVLYNARGGGPIHRKLAASRAARGEDETKAEEWTRELSGVIQPRSQTTRQE